MSIVQHAFKVRLELNHFPHVALAYLPLELARGITKAFVRPLWPTNALGGLAPTVTTALTLLGDGPLEFSALTPLGDEPTAYNTLHHTMEGCKNPFLNLHKVNLIILANDVESNPGPILAIRTQNISGMKEYNKRKRILNQAHELNRYEAGVMSLQETHITPDDKISFENMWRGGCVISPSTGQARGTILLFTNKTFETVTESYGDPNGRLAWVIGNVKDEPHLFVSIYGPNSRHGLFFKDLLCDIENIIIQNQIQKIFIMGDFNLDITEKFKGKNDKSNSVKLIKRFMKRHSLIILSDTDKHTWQRGKKTSKIDFIIGSKAKIQHNVVNWGAEISDHARIEINLLDTNIKKGPGLPRINTEFTDDPTLVNEFRIELSRQIDQLKDYPSWDPHKKLEFVKTIIRSTAFQLQSKHKINTKSKKEMIQSELNLLHERLDTVKKGNNDNSNEVKTVIRHIDTVKDELNVILESQAKYLAQRARVQWIEKGERNNKYFLSLIKQNQAKQHIEEILIDGKSITCPNRIKKEIHSFYQDLYDNQDVTNPDHFLHNINDKVNKKENKDLIKPVTLDELTTILKKSKGTTPGPDGIGNQVYKIIWDLVGQYIVDSWNFSLSTGSMPLSQRESVICLLDKKGKDRRILNNLRPITLSNCDIKLITKLYTSRITKIMCRILSTEQAAYLTNRQVHDGLRLIDNCKNYCSSNNINGYLTSLDAKKAYDSVSHDYIESSLKAFGFHNEFIKVFRVLYNDIHTKVNVNGYLTDKISIQRGVKQGDALSCALFILCMETLMKKIHDNTNIKPLNINQSQVQKIVGYADDIAIITSNKESIIESLKTYEEFSKVSGLCLNADKTEVMNLRKDDKDFIITKTYGKCNKINFINKIKICGKVFSNDLNAEFQHNIRDKIDKLEKQLCMWKKRNLTTEGNIIVAKTFGLSQIIYMLQNTHYSDKILKEVEKKVYQFIWKGTDRIKRDILKRDYCEGGLKAPCIFSLDKALKLKQLIRTSNTNHSINIFQPKCIDRGQPLLNFKSKDPFIKKGIDTFNSIGTNSLNKILSVETGDKVSRMHKYYIGNYNIDTIGHIAQLNPIMMCVLKKKTKDLNVTNLAQFPVVIHDMDLPPSHIIHQTLNRIPKKLKEITEDELHRITQRESEIDANNRKYKIVTNVNCFSGLRDIKANIILANYQNHISNTEVDEQSNPYLICRRIRHPRERLNQFLELHGKIYNNIKLHKFKIINTPNCLTCNEIETTNHLLYECQRAKDAWNAAETEIEINIVQQDREKGSSDRWLNNIISLTKTNIIRDRSNPVNCQLLKAKIKNRSQDIKFIKTNNDKTKEISLLKKLTLKTLKTKLPQIT